MKSRYAIDIKFKEVLFSILPNTRKKELLNNKIFSNLNDFQFTRNGRSALILALKKSNIKPGDIIVIPRFTCKFLHETIEAWGAKIEFIDFHSGFGPKEIDYILAVKTTNAKAVVVINYFGSVANCKQIRTEIGADLIIIQDNALSYFMDFAPHLYEGIDFVFYSFSAGKPITVGTGGILITLNPKYFQKFKLLKPKKINSLLQLWSIYLKSIVFDNIFLYQIYRKFLKKEAISEKKTYQADSIVEPPEWFYSMLYQKIYNKNFEKLDGANMLKELALRLKTSSIKVLINSGLNNNWFTILELPESFSNEESKINLLKVGLEAVIPYEDQMEFPKRYINWLLLPSPQKITDKDLDKIITILNHQ